MAPHLRRFLAARGAAADGAIDLQMRQLVAPRENKLVRVFGYKLGVVYNFNLNSAPDRWVAQIALLAGRPETIHVTTNSPDVAAASGVDERNIRRTRVVALEKWAGRFVGSNVSVHITDDAPDHPWVPCDLLVPGVALQCTAEVNGFTLTGIEYLVTIEYDYEPASRADLARSMNQWALDAEDFTPTPSV